MHVLLPFAGPRLHIVLQQHVSICTTELSLHGFKQLLLLLFMLRILKHLLGCRFHCITASAVCEPLVVRCCLRWLLTAACQQQYLPDSPRVSSLAEACLQQQWQFKQ
jgi:hypothetical protein